MKLVNVLLLVFATALIFSCKKEEEVDACTDGFLSIGEEEIDCGGTCAPCEEQIISLSKVNFNGDVITFSDFSINHATDFIFQTTNDSILIQLNFGAGDTLGGRPIETLNSNGTLNGNAYSTLTEGLVVFSKVDHNKKLLSGYYEAKLYRAVGDTMILTSGEFADISY